jgi:uncharacterized membrane protein YdjX (TVP38/TMEM64 family)
MKFKLSLSDIINYFILGIILAAIIVPCVLFWPDIIRILGTEAGRQDFQKWIASFGIWAPVVFIGVQFLQVVVFVIPGEVPQVAGGYLFGIVPGLIYSLIGIGLGSAFAFMVSRKLGLAFVTRLFGQTQVAKFERFISSNKAMVAFFLLFVIPGIPKDILCYVAGLSFLPLRLFLAISLVGRLPALIGSVVIGQAAANQNWVMLAAIAIIASVLFALGLVFRKQIHDKIESMVKHESPVADKTESGPGDYSQDD